MFVNINFVDILFRIIFCFSHVRSCRFIVMILWFYYLSPNLCQRRSRRCKSKDIPWSTWRSCQLMNMIFCGAKKRLSSSSGSTTSNFMLMLIISILCKLQQRETSFFTLKCWINWRAFWRDKLLISLSMNVSNFILYDIFFYTPLRKHATVHGHTLETVKPNWTRCWLNVD